MKKRLFIFIIAIIAALTCVIGITGCNLSQSNSGITDTKQDDSNEDNQNGNQDDEQKHRCSFTQNVAESKYLKSEATCTNKAVYYYSCECGEKGTETFESGEPIGHSFKQEKTEAQYLKMAADCTHKAVYYKSCASCGKIGNEIFEYGEPNGHNFVIGGCKNCGADEPTEGLRYTLSYDESYYIVTGIGTATDKNIIIADIFNKKPVVDIYEKAFENCNELTSVTIPHSVTNIGDYAFKGCSKLKSVTIPNSVTDIGEYAFQDCCVLPNVTIPDSVTNLGNFAFSGCSRLANILIPGSISSIGTWTFDNCSGLSSITCSATNATYASQDGILYNKDKTKILFVPKAIKGEVTIPNGVTDIWGFSNCGGLTAITLPNSIKTIGKGSFNYCSEFKKVYYLGDIVSWFDIDGLDHLMFSSRKLNINGNEIIGELVIPDGVTKISNNAFCGCGELTSVIIPDSVTSIGDNAFDGCSGLTSITIPDSVTSIGVGAFSGCSELGGYTMLMLTIPNSVTSIGEYAFSGCSNIHNVTIGNGVTSIGEGVFSGCSGLWGTITIPDSVTSIGEHAFYGCSRLRSVTIPDSVTSIGSWAFYKCGLESMTIPDSVTSIGYYAFYECSSLKTINCEATSYQAGWEHYWDRKNSDSYYKVVLGYKEN